MTQMNQTVSKVEKRNPCELLAGEIEKILDSGFVLDDNVRHYIDATFSNPTIAELEAILHDEDDCERAPLMELLLFPDESMQLQLEDLLEKHCFQKQDEEKILDILHRQPLETTFHLADNRRLRWPNIPRSATVQFVSRLHITRHLDQRLLAAVTACPGKHLQTRVKVKIRNARPLTATQKILFLGTFFVKMAAVPGNLFAALELLLEFLDGLPDQADILAGLMARKQSLARGLRQAAGLERRLQRHNVETLLLRGERITMINSTAVQQEMALLDEIALMVFGKTEDKEIGA